MDGRGVPSTPTHTPTHNHNHNTTLTGSSRKTKDTPRPPPRVIGWMACSANTTTVEGGYGYGSSSGTSGGGVSGRNQPLGVVGLDGAVRLFDLEAMVGWGELAGNILKTRDVFGYSPGQGLASRQGLASKQGLAPGQGLGGGMSVRYRTAITSAGKVAVLWRKQAEIGKSDGEKIYRGVGSSPCPDDRASSSTSAVRGYPHVRYSNTSISPVGARGAVTASGPGLTSAPGLGKTAGGRVTTNRMTSHRVDKDALETMGGGNPRSVMLLATKPIFELASLTPNQVITRDDHRLLD